MPRGLGAAGFDRPQPLEDVRHGLGLLALRLLDVARKLVEGPAGSAGGPGKAVHASARRLTTFLIELQHEVPQGCSAAPTPDAPASG